MQVCIYAFHLCVYIRMYVLEVCVHPESASKWRAISSSWIANAVLSILGGDLFFLPESESQVGFCPFWGSSSLSCLFSRMLWWMIKGALIWGAVFIFFLTESIWKNRKCLSNHNPHLGGREQPSGCSLLTQMQSHPGTNKPPISRRFDLVPGRPWRASLRSLLLSLTVTHFSFTAAFGFCCLKAAFCLRSACTVERCCHSLGNDS